MIDRKPPSLSTPIVHPGGVPAVRLARAAARGALNGVWLFIAPAVLAALVVRGLVPPLLTGTNEVVNDLHRVALEHPVPLTVALFLIFAAVAQYWRDPLFGAWLAAAPHHAGPASPSASLRHRMLGAAGALAAMGLAVGLVFAVRGGIVESYSVLSGSMLPNLRPEDRVLGNRLAYAPRRGGDATGGVPAPRRGDIIVFKSSAVDEGGTPEGAEDLVKRVIGLPGDRIAMRGGIPVINGFVVPYCDAGEYLYLHHGGENGLHGRLLVEFIDDRAYLTVHTGAAAPFPEIYEVRPGEVYVLGDNRNNSSDSRFWNDHEGGGVPLDAIEARLDWFLAGRRADHSWDFTRMAKPIQRLSTEIFLEGVNTGPLQEAIARCLHNRPEKTVPPEPSAFASGLNSKANSP